MARRPIRPLVDLALGGKLDEHLSTWRAEGLSFDRIARRLESDYEVVVSTETVRSWCSEMAEAKS